MRIFDEPSNVTVEDSAVVLKGPDAVDVALSPDAAAVTSDRLFRAALKAKRGTGRPNDESGEP